MLYGVGDLVESNLKKKNLCVEVCRCVYEFWGVVTLPKQNCATSS
jgi:hypothetical protein